MTLNIVCVNAGDYLGLGVEYTNILANMVARNISKETVYKFICFTDTPGDYDIEIDVRPLPVEGLNGWWHKLALFKKDVFPEGDRILYLDLDTVIASGLDDIIKYDGEFAILRDFHRPKGLQSSVMLWEPSLILSTIWSEFEANNFPNVPGGDQRWIEAMIGRGWSGFDHHGNFISEPDILQKLYPCCFVSYKIHAMKNIPIGAKVVVFHGLPRPHEVINGWMPYVWKIGGGTVLELTHKCNTEQAQIEKNIRHTMTLPFPWLQSMDAHEGHAVIVGGGPSLKDNLEEIRERQRHGQIIFATNNTYLYLEKNGIIPDAHVILDAREENKDFVPYIGNAIHYYASQCAPCIFDKVKGKKVVLWHSFSDGILEVIGDNTGDPLVGGGTTVGMKSIALAHILGYRNFHLYGLDSSYRGDENHAYRQPLNDGERTLEVEMNGKKYKAAPWMCAQVENFKEVAKLLVENGSIITVHGSGLLPDVARLLATPDEADTEMVKINGVWWPSKCRESRLYTEFTINDINTVIGCCNRKRTAIQAGGNVGVWPKEFSKHFERVISFEPDRLNFECLVRNTENVNNLIIINAAVGDKEGEAALNRVSYNCGAHYLTDGNEFVVKTIDSLELDFCDLIQLDIEGYEMNALKGAKKTIEAHRPVIMVEDKGLSQRYGSAKGDIEKWLEPLGYIAHAQTHRDIIFVHNERN